jgi:MFS family permease
MVKCLMQRRPLSVHPDVVRLGIVSFLTDVSSEAVFSVFSIFFTAMVGGSAALLGIVEGLADFSASSLDFLSGWLADRSGQRKPLALLGYGFSTLAKVSLLAANSVAALALFRVVERLGKSFRGPPRDAWLAGLAETSTRGYSFGVHRALDKAGAIVGPLLAYALLSRLGQAMGTFRILFIAAIIAAAAAVAVLALTAEENVAPRRKESFAAAWAGLSPGFKLYLVPATIFSLAYFSFGFLLLRAFTLGFTVKDVVLLYALFNIAFTVVAAPIGKLGDLIGRRYLVVSGYLTYLVMSVGFIFANQRWEVIVLFILFGIFYAIDEGQGKVFITDLESERWAGAIGLYNFVTGMAYLPASAIAGLLWALHPTYAFALAAALTVSALGVFLLLGTRISGPSSD